MKPLGHKVLVKPILEKKTKSGIIIPESSVKQNKGEVVFIGTKVTNLKPGDTVIYHEHVGVPIDYNNEKHIMLGCGPRNNDVICVL